MLFFVLFALCGLAWSRTVHHQWNVTWIQAAPDGFERRVIAINGQFPCPTLDLQKGDRVIIDVHNGLGDQDTSIHWHGISQRGTPYMDGAVGATQCPIPPGSSMTYDFEVSSFFELCLT
jgi:iron transport multicopper oxidase